MNPSCELTDSKREKLRTYRKYKLCQEKPKPKIVKTSSNSFKIGKITHNTNYYSSGLNILTIRAPNNYGIFFSRYIKSMEEIVICEEERKKNKDYWLATFGVNSPEWIENFGENFLQTEEDYAFSEEEEEEEEEWNFGEDSKYEVNEYGSNLHEKLKKK